MSKNPFQGNLTNKQWRKLVTLEYVLIWGYSNNYKKDLKKYKKLSKKCWKSRNKTKV